MAIPVLVRSVGPTPQGTSNYYTNWTQFVPGYPKFKNQDTGVASAFYNGAQIEANLIAYRAHYLYFTGQVGQIVDRLVDFALPLPGAGQYYDIPVDGYSQPSTGLNPNPGGSQNTQPPPPPGPEPAVIEVTVHDSFGLRSGDTRVTPWMLPGRVSERALTAQRWINMSAILNPAPGVVASVENDGEMVTQLVGQEFGFSVPSGAEVVGVEVELTRRVVGGAQEQKVFSVAASRLVGNGETGGLFWTEDFSRWRRSNVTDETRSVAFGEGKYVAGGRNGNVYVSSDGKTYTTKPLPGLSGTVYEVVHGGGVFCAPCGNRIGRSEDGGETWAAVDYPFSSTQPFGITHGRIATNGAGKWVAAPGTYIVTSNDDGESWTYRGAAVTGSFGDHWVFSHGGDFYAITKTGGGNTARWYKSTDDGVTWALLANAPQGETVNIFFFSEYTAFYIADISQPNEAVLLSSADGGTTFQQKTNVEIPRADLVYSRIAGKEPVSGKYLCHFGFETDDLAYGSYTIFALSDLASADSDFLQISGEYDAPDFTLDALIPPVGIVIDAQGAQDAAVGLNRERVGLLRGGVMDQNVAQIPIPAGRIADDGALVPGGEYITRDLSLTDGLPLSAPTDAKPFVVGGPSETGRSLWGYSTLEEDWTSAAINDPSFGVTYSARGAQGRIELLSLRARIHYRAAFSQDTLPAKRPQGLAGVAESPSGVKVAVGANGKVLRKQANSGTWDTIASGTTVSLNAVEWVGDRFIAVGLGGIALDGGADGSTWSRIETGATTSLWAIRRVPGTLRAVAVGNDDYAFQRDRQGAWSV